MKTHSEQRWPNPELAKKKPKMHKLTTVCLAGACAASQADTKGQAQRTACYHHAKGDLTEISCPDTAQNF